MNDIMEAKALLHHLEGVDISSNSWGPLEREYYIKPGPVTESALIDGVTLVCGMFVNQILPMCIRLGIYIVLAHSIKKYQYVKLYQHFL